MCRSYQNCASRRDSKGRGSHAAHPGRAQLILVFPSAVPFSTGRWVGARRRRLSPTAYICQHCQPVSGFERRRAGASFPPGGHERRNPMSEWTAEELDKIGAADELEIAALRTDGS
jgi:hypothetical protein